MKDRIEKVKNEIQQNSAHSNADQVKLTNANIKIDNFLIFCFEGLNIYEFAQRNNRHFSRYCTMG